MGALSRVPRELLAMMRSGVSVIVGSRSAAMRPSLMRAVCSHIEPDGEQVTVFLSRAQSAQLLDDIRATGQVAVVFSEPSTHHTVQLKASRASVRPAAPADQPWIDAYRAAMEREIERVGFAPHFTRAMLACRLDELVAVSFSPELAYDQTPGPRAGASL